MNTKQIQLVDRLAKARASAAVFRAAGDEPSAEVADELAEDIKQQLAATGDTGNE